jgi:hypothetical protein
VVASGTGFLDNCSIGRCKSNFEDAAVKRFRGTSKKMVSAGRPQWDRMMHVTKIIIKLLPSWLCLKKVTGCL